MDGEFVELDQWGLLNPSRCIIRLKRCCRSKASVTEVGEAFLSLHDLLDAVELVGGVVLVVGAGVVELPFDVPLVSAPTKLAIGGPGKIYGADVLKT